MKTGKRTWGAAVSVFSIALLLQSYSLDTQADTYNEFSEYPEEPRIEYSYRTASLMGVAAVMGGVMFSSLKSDKKAHFAGSVVLGAGSEYILRHLNYENDDRWRRIGIATGMGLIPGIAKETFDSKFDWGDLAADLAGSFTGALLADLMQGPVQPTIHFALTKDRIGLAVSHAF